MIDTLRLLGDYATERRLTIGVETMQPDSIREYADLIAETAHPAVGAAIDTGHIRGAREVWACRWNGATAPRRERGSTMCSTRL